MWRTDGDTWRNAAQAWSYSVANYYAPVWYRNYHLQRVDTQLYERMIILHIAHHQRIATARKELLKINKFPLNSLPVQNFSSSPSPTRLSSRLPIWLDPHLENNFSIATKTRLRPTAMWRTKISSIKHHLKCHALIFLVESGIASIG